MKTLSHHLDDYLQLRRQLGYKMREPEALLRNFVRFAQQKGAGVIRTKLALQWAAQPNMKPTQSGSRLGVVRRFAEYLSAYDARTEVPSQKLLPYHFRRRDPYHYTDENVCQLVNAARQINPTSQIKGPTFGTVLGLLAVTGSGKESEGGKDCRHSRRLRASDGQSKIIAARLAHRCLTS